MNKLLITYLCIHLLTMKAINSEISGKDGDNREFWELFDDPTLNNVFWAIILAFIIFLFVVLVFCMVWCCCWNRQKDVVSESVEATSSQLIAAGATPSQLAEVGAKRPDLLEAGATDSQINKWRSSKEDNSKELRILSKASGIKSTDVNIESNKSIQSSEGVPKSKESDPQRIPSKQLSKVADESEQMVKLRAPSSVLGKGSKSSSNKSDIGSKILTKPQQSSESSESTPPLVKLRAPSSVLGTASKTVKLRAPSSVLGTVSESSTPIKSAIESKIASKAQHSTESTPPLVKLRAPSEATDAKSTEPEVKQKTPKVRKSEYKKKFEKKRKYLDKNKRKNKKKK